MILELENTPDSLIQETHDFLLFLKNRRLAEPEMAPDIDSPALEAALLPAVTGRHTLFRLDDNLQEVLRRGARLDGQWR